MVSPEALDLLSKMLVYDKNERIKCKDAMNHSYFDPIRDFIKDQREKQISQQFQIKMEKKK